MTDPLIETVRGWLIEERVGLISRTELVSRVDEAIAKQVAFSAARLIPDSQGSYGQFMAIADGLHVAQECGEV